METAPTVFPHPPGPAEGILPEAPPSGSSPTPSARAAAAAMDGDQQGDVLRAPAQSAHAQSGQSGLSGGNGQLPPSGTAMEVEQAPLVGPGGVKQEKDGSGGGGDGGGGGADESMAPPTGRPTDDTDWDPDIGDPTQGGPPYCCRSSPSSRSDHGPSCFPDGCWPWRPSVWSSGWRQCQCSCGIAGPCLA